MGAVITIVSIIFSSLVLLAIVLEDQIKAYVETLSSRRSTISPVLEDQNKRLQLQASSGTDLLRAIMADTCAVLPSDLERSVQVHLAAYPPELDPSPKKGKKKLM